MLVLLGTTLTASFLDSLNPSAIAQQMLLQAMVRKKRHVLFFILGISLANLVLGLAVYYGLAAWVLGLLAAATEAWPLAVYGGELAAGLACLGAGLWLVGKTRRGAAQAEDAPKVPARLGPFPLFCLGAAFCGVELTSALPYFGFLAMLAGYGLGFPLVLAFIALYTLVYALPLILLYLGYNRLQGTRAIRRLEGILGRVSAYVVPVVLALAGAALAVYGALSLA